MTTWQSGDVEANGIRLHYTRTGGGKLPLVLAHGITDDGLCWTPVAEALAPDYDVVMVDARGHGRSAGPEQGYDPATQADDLAGVIAALKLQQPAVLGHSMGAATTLVLAGAYPDVPRAILLEDPPGWWIVTPDGSDPFEQRRAEMRASFIELKRKTREELLAEQRATTPGWSDSELGPWADAKLRVSFNALNLANAAAVDWPATLRRITCSALLITGDPALGALITDDSAAALRALVPQLSIAHIPQSGHSIRRDQLERYLQVVRAFLHETMRER